MKKKSLLKWLLLTASLFMKFRGDSILTCCSQEILLSPQNLIECAKIPAFNTTSKIGIVTYATQNYIDFAAYSFAVNAAYAEKNGYSFLVFDSTNWLHEEPDTRWNKVFILEEVLTGIGQSLDYVLWIDADAIFLNFSFRIEDIVYHDPNVSLFVSSELFQLSLSDSVPMVDSANLINTGTMLFKNTPWSLQFLSDYKAFADRSLYSDQTAFDLLIASWKDPLQLLHISILPPHILNSNAPAMLWQQPNDSILHLMGEHPDYRRVVFKNAFQAVCLALSLPFRSTPLPLLPQLNCTASNLRLWYLNSVYPPLLSRINALNFPPAQHHRKLLNDGDASVMAASMLSAVHMCSRLAAAILFGNSATADKECLTLVRKCFQSTFNMLSYVRQQNNAYQQSNNGKNLTAWHEVIQPVAQLGELLSTIWLSNRVALRQTVLELLQEGGGLWSEGGESPMSSLARLHRSMGQVLLPPSPVLIPSSFPLSFPSTCEGEADMAITHIMTSLSLYRRLSPAYGSQILSLINLTLAQAYTRSCEYDKAASLFLIALNTAKQRLGEEHFFVAHILLLYGESCLLSGGVCMERDENGVEALTTSTVLLNRSLHILQAVGFPVRHMIYRRAEALLSAIISHGHATDKVVEVLV